MKQTRNSQNPASLEDLISKAWQESASLGVPCERDTASVRTAVQPAQMWNPEIYFYSHRAAKGQLSQIEGQEIGIAFFNEDGYMVQSYTGCSRFEQELAARQLIPGSCWALSALGANAVSVGLCAQQNISMEGSQNYCRCLRGFSSVFHPLMLESNINWSSNISLSRCSQWMIGGVALLYRDSAAKPLCECIAHSIIRETSSFYYLLFATHRLLSLDNRAVIAVNIDPKKTYSIFNYNLSTFHIFNLTPKPLFGQRLDSIIDHSPDNDQFWDIVNSGNPQKNVPILLRINGTLGKYTLSLLHDQADTSMINNITLIVDSDAMISRNISHKIGNNAYFTFPKIIGMSPPFQEVIKQAKLMAERDRNILILGESGTGKDVFAQAIHNALSLIHI